MKLRFSPKILGTPSAQEEALSCQQGYPDVSHPGSEGGAAPLFPRPKDKTIGVRLSVGLHTKVATDARQAGLSTAEFVRVALFTRNQRLIRLRLMAHISRALAVIAEQSNNQVETLPYLIGIERFIKTLEQGLKNDRRVQ